MQEEILTLISNSTLTEREKEKALSYYNNYLRQVAPTDKIHIYDQDHLSKTPNALLGAYELFRIINNDMPEEELEKRISLSQTTIEFLIGAMEEEMENADEIFKELSEGEFIVDELKICKEYHEEILKHPYRGAISFFHNGKRYYYAPHNHSFYLECYAYINYFLQQSNLTNKRFLISANPYSYEGNSEIAISTILFVDKKTYELLTLGNFIDHWVHEEKILFWPNEPFNLNIHKGTITDFKGTRTDPYLE